MKLYQVIENTRNPIYKILAREVLLCNLVLPDKYKLSIESLMMGDGEDKVFVCQVTIDVSKTASVISVIEYVNQVNNCEVVVPHCRWETVPSRQYKRRLPLYLKDSLEIILKEIDE